MAKGDSEYAILNRFVITDNILLLELNSFFSVSLWLLTNFDLILE